MAYERNAGGSGTSNPVNSGGKIGGAAINLVNKDKKKETEPRQTGLISTSEIGNPVNSGNFSKSKERATEAATPSYDDWERQEQERLLAEERRRKQEYEQEQNALKAEQWVEQHNKPVVEEPVVEQPSAGYMPYGDPRKKPNPVSYYTPEEQQSNDVVANTTSALEVPVYTPAQQNRDNLKAGTKTSANKAEDETEFYTRTPETDIDVTNPLAYKPQGFAETLLNIGVKPAVAERYYDPNTGKTYYDSLIEAIQGKPAYDWSNVTVTSTTTPRREGELRAEANMLPYIYPDADMLFPTDYGGTTIPNMPETPNPLAGSQQAVKKLSGALINGAKDITRPIADSAENALYDTIADVYNSSNSDGWLTQQVSNLYGNLPAIDPDSPMADVLEQQRRDRLAALVAQIQADDELVDDRPKITGEDVKAAIEESQQGAREYTDSLRQAAREITQPMTQSVKDWATSGSNYGEAVSSASDAAIKAGFTPGTAAYERFVDNYVKNYTPQTTTNNPVNPTTYTTAWEQADKAARDAGIPEGTNDYDRFVENYVSNVNPLFNNPQYAEIEKEVRNEFSGLNSTYANELANGDPRNVPPEAFAETYRYLTGDTEYAQELEKKYQQYKDLGMNDRQISAELYRQAAQHQNPLARATDQSGNLHFDYVSAREGLLPDELTYPEVDENGNGNAVYNEFANSVQYFDDNGMSLYRDDNGTYYQGVPQADGTVKYEKYKGDVTAHNKYDAQDILSMYVNPNARQGDSAWRGLDNVFEGLTPEERKGMEELLANFVRGGDLDAIREGFPTEFANMTEAEYEKFVQLFLSKMPALQKLIDDGVISRTELENFFFKNIDDGSGNGTRSGSGTGGNYGGYYRGYGGGGYYPYYRGGSSGGGSYYTPNRVSGGSASPNTANQRQSRIYNIMKNWSF